MAGSMNKVILVGRLGQDPKLSYTPGGDAVANLSVATDEGYRNRQTGQRVERTEWHRCVAWRNTAEFCGNYLGKGRLVLIEGKLQTRKWQGQDGQDRYATEIVVDRIQGLDKAPENGQGQQPGGYRNQRPTQQGQGQQYHQAPPDEDLGPAFPSEASGMDDVPF